MRWEAHQIAERHMQTSGKGWRTVPAWLPVERSWGQSVCHSRPPGPRFAT